MTVAAIAALATSPLQTPALRQVVPQVERPISFAQLVAGGVTNVETKVSAADKAVRAFVLDDAVPVHQVSFALQQAQLSLELMLQIRNRLVEGYQQLMNMQM